VEYKKEAGKPASFLLYVVRGLQEDTVSAETALVVGFVVAAEVHILLDEVFVLLLLFPIRCGLSFVLQKNA